MKAPAKARILRTLRAARRYVAADRRTILECHTKGATGLRSDLDDIGREYVKGTDRVIAQLDAAIIEIEGQS